MKVVVQRCKRAKCTVDNNITGQIEHGYMLLVGFTHTDNIDVIDKMVKKIINLRIFEDEQGKMNKNILQVNGSILSISQFTLYANTNEGNRPSFINAMKPDLASNLYNIFNAKLKENNIHVECGIFGADMQIDFVNDGPVTIILEF